MTFTGQSESELFSSGVAPGPLQDQNLVRRLKLVQQAVPIFSQGDGIQVATQMASNLSWDDNMLVKTAQAAGGEIVIGSLKEHLTSIEDPWKQLQQFKQFDKGQQALLLKAGYVVPEAQEPEMTEFGIVKKLVGGALGTAGEVIGAKYLLRGFDWAGGLGTHAYRAVRLSVEEGKATATDSEFVDEAAIKKDRANTLGYLTGLWGRTKEGEAVFSMKSRERVHRTIPEEDKFEFTKAVAEGKSVYDYLTEDLELDEGTPLFEQETLKYTQYQNQDDVAEAVKDLRNNKYSPGRDLASGIGMDRGTMAYNVTSGGLDGVFRIVSDPTLIGGKIYKGYRLSRYGFETALLKSAETGGQAAASVAGRIDYLATVPRFQRAADEIAAGFRNGTEAQLLDKLPQMRGGGLEDFNNYILNEGVKNGLTREAVTRETVFDYFKSTAGTLALRKGTFAAPHFPGTILPSMTRPEALKSGLAIGAKSWVEGFRLADYGFDALEPAQLAELFGGRMWGVGPKETTLLRAQKGVGNAIHSFYTKVPKYDYMGPDHEHGLETFRAVLDYSLPDFIRDDFVNDWMRTSNWSARRSIYEAGIESMFHYSGLLTDDAGEKLLNKSLRTAQGYGPNGVDLLDNTPTGIGEADLAEYWAIPDFREMLKATRKTTWFRRALDGTNEGIADRFFANYWKPAVLLKAGFIPRAYGEEYLGFILREGPRAYAKAQLAITATKEGYLLPLRPVAWMSDSLLSHIPLTIRDKPLEVYARNAMESTSQFVRNWSEKLAPDEYLAAVRHAAAHGGLAVDELGTTIGAFAPSLDKRLMQETVGREIGGEIVQVPIRHGEFTTHLKGSISHPHTVLREMRRMQSDRLFAPLMDAGRRQFSLEEGQSAVRLFADAGIIDAADDINYVAGLRKIRQLVPNKVMPKFEAMLKNDSFASVDSVTSELVENGLEHADAISLVEHIKAMPPRQRVAIFTRDGQLERMYQPHTLDPDAMWDPDSSLPWIRGEVEEQSLREYHQVLEELWSQGGSATAYQRLALRRLTSGDMVDTVRKSYRSTRTLDGRTVATPPARGTRRVYTVLVDSNFEDLGEVRLAKQSTKPAIGSGPGAPIDIGPNGDLLDIENGYIPFQSAEVNSFIPDYEPDLRPMDAPGGEVTSPDEMAWFTQDFAHAGQMRDQMATKLHGQSVSVGYVDIPEDVYLQGRNAAKANIAGGMDPLALQNQANQVWVPKTWRENYQVLGDGNYQMIDGHAAVGASAEEALQDWAHVLTLRYAQVFESVDHLGLRDIQHDLIDGRVTVNNIVDNGQYLADAAMGPAIMEPSRENWFKQLTTKGFDAVGRGGNALIRNQMYLHYYTQRLAVETERMAAVLGESGATNIINDFSDRLGTKHYQLVSDWQSLPEDVRNAVNPYEAMIARDPIPPALRSGIDLEDQKTFAEAWTALYEHDNPDLLEDARKLWMDKYVKTRRIEEYTFDSLQDSYLSLEDDLRESIMHNGLPPQLPKSFEAAGAGRLVEEVPAKPFGMTEEQFVARERELDLRNKAAEKESDPTTWTTAEKAAYTAEDYETFSQLRGYTDQEIADHQEWLKMVNPGEGYEYKWIDVDEVDAADIYQAHLAAMPVGQAISGGLDADDWTVLRDALNTNRHVYKTAHDVATRAAINDTIPWIDDHRVRSQFQQHGRNLIPFWFSQENFIKRAANNIWRDPAAIRKAQVLMDGLQNSGVVTQNQYGEDVYNIPMTGVLTKVVMKGMDWLPGDGKWSLPVVSAMTGQLKYTVPGLDTFDRIGPSVSPLLGLPLRAVTTLFPELEGAQNALLGERGSSDRNPFDLIMKSLVPSYAYKMFEAVSKDIESDSEYASAMIQTIQMLEVAGHGIPESADPYELDDHLDKVENFTRMQMFLRGIVGFFSPAAPSTNPVEELTPAFQEMLREMPLEEAMLQFMTEHPNARAYTIMKTEVPSKAPLSASQEAGKVLDDHADFFNRHKMAGTWLLPQSKDDTGFSNKTYNTQIAREMRTRKSPKEWYDDYYFAAAAEDYFASKENYELQMEAAKGSPQMRKQITDSYQGWKDGYLKDHKIFARLLVDPDAQVRRREVLDQMDAALNDPEAPDAVHKDALASLVGSYKNYVATKDQYKRGNNAELMMRQNINDSFSVWVRQFVSLNPGVQAFYDRIIRPEMEF